MTTAQIKLKSAMKEHGALKLAEKIDVPFPKLYQYLGYPEKKNCVNPQRMYILTAMKFLQIGISYDDWFEEV